MKVAGLAGVTLGYWVARSLHDFVREIHFTDSGDTEGDVLRGAQALNGERAQAIGGPTAEGPFGDVASLGGQIGDIQSPPR